MGDRGDISNEVDFQADSLQGTNGCFPSSSGTLDTHLDLPHTLIHSLFGRSFRGHLGCKRRAFPGALKPMRARTGPADHVPYGIGDGDNRIIERGLDVRHAFRDILPFAAPLSSSLSPATCHIVPLLFRFLLGAHRSPRTFTSAGVGPCSLPADR
jgi:hypothetical protein